MKDKELLRKAAKAVGIDHPGGDHCLHGDSLWDCDALRWWNSLESVGDAENLAVFLGFEVICTDQGVNVTRDDVLLAFEPLLVDNSSKTKCRAITRAAASVCK